MLRLSLQKSLLKLYVKVTQFCESFGPVPITSFVGHSHMNK